MGYHGKNQTWILVYVACGMSLGGVMAALHTESHTLAAQQVLMVGVVLSLVYCLIHKLWLITTDSLNRFTSVIYLLHNIRQAGAMTMFTALLLLYGNVFLDAHLESLQAIVSLTVLLAALSMLYLYRVVPLPD